MEHYNRLEEDMEEGEELFTVENHYALFAFYDDFKCLSRGEIFLSLQIDGMFLDLFDKLTAVGSLLQMSNEDFTSKIQSTSIERERLCREIFDHCLLVKVMQTNSYGVIIQKLKLIVDPKVPAMTTVIDQMKLEKYKKKMDQGDRLENEFPETKPLGINLNILAESMKHT